MRDILKVFSVIAFVVLVIILCTRGGGYGHWANESSAWDYVSSQNNKNAYVKYLDKFPTGRHEEDARIAIQTFNLKAEIESAYNSLMSNPTSEQCQRFLDKYPNSQHEQAVRKKLNSLLLAELEATYGDNSLWTGATPYSSWYGGNYSRLYYDYSTIKVTAPYNSDVVVIVKKNNANGSVAVHGYIKAGETLSLDMPNGRYQTFFYYGRGWYPEKQMSGVRGGFLKDEVFSKADSEYLEDVELSYVLQLTTNGNFSTKSSNSSEIF